MSLARVYLNLVNYGSPLPAHVPQLVHPVPGVLLPQHAVVQQKARPSHFWRDEGSAAAEAHLLAFSTIRFASLIRLVRA